MTLKQLLSHVRKAIDEYQMIEEGDRIAIGVSGGKDSLALLYAMAKLRLFYPKHFEIIAITVDLSFQEMNFEKIASFCEQLSVPYYIEKTNIGDVVFDIRKESNPCSLCSKLRKGAFNKKAKELGCNKAAYAHHMDDVANTLLLSLLYEGRYQCFAPVTYLDRSDITLIRPLIFVAEEDIVQFQKYYSLPVQKNKCPADGKTKRSYISSLIESLEKEDKGIKNRLFHAVSDGPLPFWRKPER